MQLLSVFTSCTTTFINHMIHQASPKTESIFILSLKNVEHNEVSLQSCIFCNTTDEPNSL